MQELLRNVSRHLEALLTPPTLLQLAAILVVVLLAWWFGRQLISTERAKAAVLQSGLRARVAEALLIASPHLTALVLIAALGGVLHAIKAPSQLIDLAITLAGLMLIIRVAVYVVRLSLGNRTKGWGNTIPVLDRKSVV